MNRAHQHPSIACGRFASRNARGYGSLGLAAFGRRGLTPGTAHGPAQELRLLVLSLGEAFAAACRCRCVGYRCGDRRLYLFDKRCSWRSDRLVGAFRHDRRAIGELAALDRSWPWHTLLAIAAVVTLLTLWALLTHWTICALWTIRTAFAAGMPVLARLITLLGPLILALPLSVAARIWTAITAWLASILVAVLVAVWAAVFTTVFTTIWAPILAIALFARALTEVAVAAAIPILALLIALILALILALALPVLALAVFALLALAVVLLARAAVHAALRGIVHPRLLLGALHRTGTDIRPAVLLVVADIAALLERLPALAAELAWVVHAAGRGFATLQHLLFAIRQDDAIVVFGVLQIVLGQHRVVG